MLLLMHEDYQRTQISPLSIARYSFIQLSELERCRIIKTCPRFDLAPQVLNLGSLSQESKGVPSTT